jgi:hypothetical protein
LVKGGREREREGERGEGKRERERERERVCTCVTYQGKRRNIYHPSFFKELSNKNKKQKESRGINAGVYFSL